MTSGSIPRRYARALLSLGVEHEEFEKIGNELDEFAALLVNKELRVALENPSILPSKRKAVVRGLIERLRTGTTVKSFLLLAADRNRLDLLPAIAREYRALADTHAGRVRAQVTTAQPLDGASVTRLRQALEQKTGKQVILEQRTDADLIAGMVTQVGSTVYDGSIRTRLEQLRQTLLEGER